MAASAQLLAQLQQGQCWRLNLNSCALPGDPSDPRPPRDPSDSCERPPISSECANKSCLPRSVCPVCIASRRAARKLCMVCLALLRTSHDQFHCTVSRHAHQLSSNIALKDMRTPGVDPGSQACLDTLGIEPRAFRMRSGCDTTTPCAL